MLIIATAQGQVSAWLYANYLEVYFLYHLKLPNMHKMLKYIGIYCQVNRSVGEIVLYK